MLYELLHCSYNLCASECKRHHEGLKTDQWKRKIKTISGACEGEVFRTHPFHESFKVRCSEESTLRAKCRATFNGLYELHDSCRELVAEQSFACICDVHHFSFSMDINIDFSFRFVNYISDIFQVTLVALFLGCTLNICVAMLTIEIDLVRIIQFILLYWVVTTICSTLALVSLWGQFDRTVGVIVLWILGTDFDICCLWMLPTICQHIFRHQWYIRSTPLVFISNRNSATFNTNDFECTISHWYRILW